MTRGAGGESRGSRWPAPTSGSPHAHGVPGLERRTRPRARRERNSACHPCGSANTCPLSARGESRGHLRAELVYSSDDHHPRRGPPAGMPIAGPSDHIHVYSGLGFGPDHRRSSSSSILRRTRRCRSAERRLPEWPIGPRVMPHAARPCYGNGEMRQNYSRHRAVHRRPARQRASWQGVFVPSGHREAPRQLTPLPFDAAPRPHIAPEPSPCPCDVTVPLPSRHRRRRDAKWLLSGLAVCPRADRRMAPRSRVVASRPQLLPRGTPEGHLVRSRRHLSRLRL